MNSEYANVRLPCRLPAELPRLPIVAILDLPSTGPNGSPVSVLRGLRTTAVWRRWNAFRIRQQCGANFTACLVWPLGYDLVLDRHCFDNAYAVGYKSGI